ncbi:MAG: AAA family ATPase, partial [bacterium]|nr:AAA family ATPase [bacterium]
MARVVVDHGGADEAFLRRIPYKVHVTDPDEVEYADLMELLAKKMGVRLTRGSVKYLIERHYHMPKRPMRF